MTYEAKTGDTCSSCTWWAGLKPGHAGICMEKQKGREWNEAMALTNENATCDKFKAQAKTEG